MQDWKTEVNLTASSPFHPSAISSSIIGVAVCGFAVFSATVVAEVPLLFELCPPKMLKYEVSMTLFGNSVLADNPVTLKPLEWVQLDTLYLYKMGTFGQ